jgi:serine/threonine-protein kinase
MSPEQAKGRELDRRADLFSVGVMIFEACIGERMWKGVKEVDVLQTLLGRRHPRNPQMINPDVHDDLDAICHRALSVIDHRYQTATELLHDLEGHLEEHVERPTREQISELLKTKFAEKRAIVDARIEAKLNDLAEENASMPAKPPAPPMAAMAAMADPSEVLDGDLLLERESAPPPPGPPPIGPGEPTPRSSKPLFSPQEAELVAAARAARALPPSDREATPSEPTAEEAEEEEAAAARRHTIRLAAMLVAAAVVASLLTLLVQKLL